MNLAVNLAVVHLQRLRLGVQKIGAGIVRRLVAFVGVLGGHLQIVNLLLFELLDLLVRAPEFLGLAVVALVLVAAHAAALFKQELTFADDLAGVAADQHHVAGMAVLATRLDVFFWEQRPQPVLVSAVRLYHAGGSPAIPLVAGGAAEFF